MDKEALEALLRTLDNWGAFFILLVVLGVGGELFVHLRQSSANKKLTALQRSEAKAQEAEIVRLNKDAEGFRLDVAKANERAAEANRLAEQEKLARLKIEERLAPRSLNKEQSDKLTAAVRKFTGQKIEIAEYGLSREASSLSKQIQAALAAAKWDTSVVAIMSGVEIEPGIHILIAQGQTQFPAVTGLLQILKEQGFVVTFRYDAGFSGPILPAPGVIRMVVGPKP
jgi:hypothetical protein